MMTTEAVLILESTITEGGHLYVSATCGATEAFVDIGPYGVRVLCQNQRKRGAGRSFQTISEAVSGYKSPAMKAIIQAADGLNH